MIKKACGDEEAQTGDFAAARRRETPLHAEKMMRRGEIWWADFSPPVGRRPVVLISRDAPAGETVLVARITARIREIPAEVPLGAEDGLPKTVINTEMLCTIPKSDLVSRIAGLSPRKLALLEEALRYVLDLPAGESDRPRLPVKEPRIHFGGSSFREPPQ